MESLSFPHSCAASQHTKINLNAKKIQSICPVGQISTDKTSDELTFLNDCFDKMATCFGIVYNRL